MNSFREKLINKIALEEGFSEFPYQCTGDKLTTGYGFNLESTPMPKVVADFWLVHIINERRNELAKHGWYGRLSENRKVVILDMSYQMGLNGVFNFKKMIHALTLGNYIGASLELMDSSYAKKTPNRAIRNAKILRTDEL